MRTFVEKDFYAKGFEGYYLSAISKQMQTVETDRLVALRDFTLLAMAAAAGSLAAWSLGISSFWSFVLFIATFVLSFQPLVRYQSTSKVQLLPEVMRYFGETYSFQYAGRNHNLYLPVPHLLPEGAHFEASRTLKGTYKDAPIEVNQGVVTGEKPEAAYLLRFNLSDVYEGSNIVDYKMDELKRLRSADIAPVILSSAFEMDMKGLHAYARHIDQANAVLGAPLLTQFKRLIKKFNAKRATLVVHDNTLNILLYTDSRMLALPLLSTVSRAQVLKPVVQSVTSMISVIDAIRMQQSYLHRK